jgi:hypothetical protein
MPVVLLGRFTTLLPVSVPERTIRIFLACSTESVTSTDVTEIDVELPNASSIFPKLELSGVFQLGALYAGCDRFVLVVMTHP